MILLPVMKSLFRDLEEVGQLEVRCAEEAQLVGLLGELGTVLGRPAFLGCRLLGGLALLGGGHQRLPTKSRTNNPASDPPNRTIPPISPSIQIMKPTNAIASAIRLSTRPF